MRLNRRQFLKIIPPLFVCAAIGPGAALKALEAPTPAPTIPRYGTGLVENTAQLWAKKMWEGAKRGTLFNKVLSQASGGGIIHVRREF